MRDTFFPEHGKGGQGNLIHGKGIITLKLVYGLRAVAN
jgi:hypothetical protein